MIGVIVTPDGQLDDIGQVLLEPKSRKASSVI